MDMDGVGVRRRTEGRLLQRLRADPRIVAVARTGSTARVTADRWSDLDLFLGVHPAHTVAAVLADLNRWAATELGVVHFFDLHVTSPGGPVTYRALLLGDGLEVDLGAARSPAFAPLDGQAFDVVFDDRSDHHGGQHQHDDTPDEHPAPASPVQHLVGLGWHHALHARTAIERQRHLQAQYWISALRDHAATLAAIRHGLPTEHAKGADDLPADIRRDLTDSLVAHLDRAELLRARAAAVATFLAEVDHVDAATGAALRPLLAGAARLGDRRGCSPW